MTEERCIACMRTGTEHHNANARIFPRNHTPEMELRPPWWSFGVSGHLHRQRCFEYFTSERVSEQENTPAVALNDGAVWSHSYHPPGVFHSSRHADFGVELEWNTQRWSNQERPTRRVHVRASAMRDGRLVYLRCALRDPAAMEHLCCVVGRNQVDLPSLNLPEIHAKIGAHPCESRRE